MPSSRISLVDEKENSQMEQIQKHIRNVSNKILYYPHGYHGKWMLQGKGKTTWYL